VHLNYLRASAVIIDEAEALQFVTVTRQK
jgi:hypothetical protein